MSSGNVFDNVKSHVNEARYADHVSEVRAALQEEVNAFVKTIEKSGVKGKLIKKQLDKHVEEGIKQIASGDLNGLKDFHADVLDNLKQVSQDLGVDKAKGFAKLGEWLGEHTSVHAVGGGLASAIEGTFKAAGAVSKAVVSPITIPASAAMQLMGRHKIATGVAAAVAAGAYLAAREDKIPEAAEQAVNQLDAAGQHNAAMLNTMVAAQRMSPSTRIAASDAQYQGGQAFAQNPAMGAVRG